MEVFDDKTISIPLGATGGLFRVRPAGFFPDCGCGMSQTLFGLLNVDKPQGLTSRQVVNRVVRAVRPAKAGHAGTLDPMASGVLVVGIGRATRLIPHVQRQPKTYSATFLFGRRSDTDDVTGDVTAVPVNRPPTRNDVETALAAFVGCVDQIPPQFSAVHVDGKRAYKLAREGRQVELRARRVEIHGIELMRYEFPEVDVEIRCGSGTYVRSIGRDLGNMLGCGAVMSRLTRTAVGPFHLKNAIDASEIRMDVVAGQMLPAVMAVADLPQYVCSNEDLKHIQQGRRIPTSGANGSFGGADSIAVLATDGNLVALAEPIEHGRFLAPKQVFCGSD